MSIYMASVMSFFKPFLTYATQSVQLNGLPILLDLLKTYPDRKLKNMGLLTISNHISTLDDPMAWGIMPMNTFLHPSTVRWTLGASDILFTNPLIAPLFRNGQVIETFRGQGIYQPAIETAIDKLDQAQWVHIFPEGRVNQPGIDPNQLLRFKWGVSRIILEASQAPIILPIYLQGFEKVMPENRRWPFSFLPRPFQSIKISIGSPILSGSSLDSLRSRFGLTDDESQKRQIRIELANSLRHELASLGTTTHFHPPPQHLS